MRCNGLQPGGALGGLRSRIGLLDQHIGNRERAIKRACYPLLRHGQNHPRLRPDQQLRRHHHRLLGLSLDSTSRRISW